MAKVLFCSEEFIFWAEVDVKNFSILSQNLNISKSMVLSKNRDFKYLCSINSKKDQNVSTINYLNLNKDRLLECFSLNMVKIKNSFYKKNSYINNHMNMRVLPVRFIVEFKSSSAIIGVSQYKVK